MSPNTFDPNDVLRDDNYFLWEFNARMTLARKDLLDHVMVKSDHMMLQGTAEWKASDIKALAVIARLPSPTYQSMIREVATAIEAWEILRTFFMKRNLHNRVQLRKQLHEFEMRSGESLMEHLMQFDDLCLRLSSVGDRLDDGERLVILLGSLSHEYDNIVKIIEARGDINLLEAKEILRREYESLQRRDKHEGAFKAATHGNRGQCNRFGNHQPFRSGGNQNRSSDVRYGSGGAGAQRQSGRSATSFNGRCFPCNRTGHKQNQCPRRQNQDRSDELVFTATTEVSSDWLLDSGASSHMTHERGDFCEYKELDGTINIAVASGHRFPARGGGSVRFAIGNGRFVKMPGVQHVPGIDRKLLSIPALAAKDVSVSFQHGSCSINSTESRFHPLPSAESSLSVRQGSRETWHARLGHVSNERMKAAARAAHGVLAPDDDEEEGPCDGCARGKMSVRKFVRQPSSRVKTSGILEIVHSDVMGPMEIKAKGGARFVVTFIDVYSRYVHINLLKSKSEVFDRFVEFKTMVETQASEKIKCVRTDNGGEHTSKRFNQFCALNGIVHQTSAPYTPQQNGLAERMNRTITEIVTGRSRVTQHNTQSEEACVEHLPQGLVALGENVRGSPIRQSDVHSSLLPASSRAIR